MFFTFYLFVFIRDVCLLVITLHFSRVEALLQPRANFKFLAKYFQGAYVLICHEIRACIALYLIEM